MKNIAVFGSGKGGNAENIYNYFRDSNNVRVVLFCTNNKNALIVTRAKKIKIPIVCIKKEDLSDFYILQKLLKRYEVDFIILAGFLLKIPFKMVTSYKDRIINIHPSLLPKYGGKGMYGDNVHKSVLANNESESGITIHFVNQNYDEGRVILQKKCALSSIETIDSLKKKIQALEHKYFPKTIEKTILK